MSSRRLLNRCVIAWLVVLSVALSGLARASKTPRRLQDVDGTWLTSQNTYPVTAPPIRSYPAYAWCSSLHGLVIQGGIDPNSFYLDDTWLLTTGARPEWQEIVPSGSRPSVRSRHTAIHDPVRDRFLIFGGQRMGTARNDVWVLSLSATPQWTQLTPDGAPPARRYGHCAIYDPVRDRMIVFGGRGQFRYNDVWVLSLVGTPRWDSLATAGTPPTPRDGEGAIYDPVRDRMVIYGGRTSAADMKEVWSLDLGLPTPTWSLLDTTGIAFRTPVPVYDSVRDRMLSWGGDLESFDLSTSAWSSVAVATLPSAGWHTAAAYDPDHDGLVVTTGDGTPDGWMLSFADPPRWLQFPIEKPVTIGPAPAVYGNSAVYDPLHDQMVIWDRDEESTVVGLLHLSPAIYWTSVGFGFTLPPAMRRDHRSVIDTARDRMLVFGGCSIDGTTAFDDVWSFSLDAPYRWQQVFPDGIPPPDRHSAGVIYDPVRDRLVVTGGLTAAGGALGDTWALTLSGTPKWAPLATSGTAPPAGASKAIYDASQDRMLVAEANGVWALVLAGVPEWSQVSSATSPGMSIVLDTERDRLLAMKDDPSLPLPPMQVWALPLDAPSAWTLLTPTGPTPRSRQRASAVYDPLRDRYIFVGGEIDCLEGPDPYCPLYYSLGVLDFSESGHDCGCAADVVSFEPGLNTWWAVPSDVLGLTDGYPLTLGSGGAVTLRLTHPVADRNGPDLYVIENHLMNDDAAENYQVEASLDGESFVPIGSSLGGTYGFDLAGSGLGVARYLRITDLAPDETVAAGMAGADLDAVVVLHCSLTTDVASGTVATAHDAIAAVRPNPGAGAQFFELRLVAGEAPRTLAVYSADGRRVWARGLAGLGPGDHLIVWDGRGTDGRRVPPAMYFVRLEGTSEPVARRFARIR